ncbi:MAG TPA: hypothetical protein VMX36_05945 [Sedimentisphaerales bacterium]|nr:hypothetical protein [Sedimentisphaerales bacterium]
MKKQSQFVPARNDANSYMKGDYDNKPASGAEENKANSNPIKANFKVDGLFGAVSSMRFG